jgi:hypothetical protein
MRSPSLRKNRKAIGIALLPAGRLRDRLHEEPRADSSRFTGLRSARISLARFVLSLRD